MLSAVIIVGGRGTRLSPVTCNLPKPLVSVNGKPFLYYIFKQLYSVGVKKIILLAGYLGNEFKEFKENYASEFKNLNIFLKISDPSFDTGERLLDSIDILDKRFLFLYGDNFIPFDLKNYLINNEKKLEKSFLVVYKNNDGYSRSNISLSKQNLVLKYGKEKNPEVEYVDVGYFILNKCDLVNIKKTEGSNFGKNILTKLVQKNKVYAEIVNQRYYTVGTMERLQLTKLLFSGEKYIFIDRDGVLNEKQERGTYVTNTSLFKWKKGALEGLKLLKQNSYQVILITNQAGIGRGYFSINDLEKIHRKMCREARDYGGEIDFIYFCPHHWDDNCECRKPKPGMFIQAQKDLNLDLTNIFFIGDDLRDGEAAKLAGCKFRMLESKDNLYDLIRDLIKKRIL